MASRKLREKREYIAVEVIAVAYIDSIFERVWPQYAPRLCALLGRVICMGNRAV